MEVFFFEGGGGGGGGVFFTPKRSLKNSFSGVKITQILTSWNNPQKGVILYLKLLLHLNRAESKEAPIRVKTTHVRSKITPFSELF